MSHEIKIVNKCKLVQNSNKFILGYETKQESEEQQNPESTACKTTACVCMWEGVGEVSIN